MIKKTPAPKPAGGEPNFATGYGNSPAGATDAATIRRPKVTYGTAQTKEAPMTGTDEFDHEGEFIEQLDARNPWVAVTWCAVLVAVVATVYAFVDHSFEAAVLGVTFAVLTLGFAVLAFGHWLVNPPRIRYYRRNRS